MKTNFIKTSLLFVLLALASCNNNIDDSSILNTTTNDTNTSTNNDVTSKDSNSSDDNTNPSINYDNIDDFKNNANIDDSCTIKGVIAGYLNTSSGYNGAFIVGDTGSIYCYSTTLFTNTNVGDEVKIEGTFSRYISTQEATMGKNIGWYGSRQIKVTNLTILNSNVSYYSNVEETTIRNIVKTTFTKLDISSNVYKAPCKISKVANTGYTNYYFYDLSLDYNVYAYTAMSGKDYSWVDTYDNTIHYVYFGIQGLRPKDQVWRIIPLYIENEELSDDYNDETLVSFALNRLEDQFQEEYQSYGPKDLIIDDEKLVGETISYISTNGFITDDNKLLIDPSKFVGSTKITIKITYNSIEYNRDVNFVVKEDESYTNLKTVTEILNGNEGDLVTVSGIYVRFTANNPGIYLADSTGIIQVNTSTNLDELITGEKVIFEGTISKAFVVDNVYDGHNILNEATLLSHDGTKHEWDKTLIAGEETVESLYQEVDYSKIGKIYKVKGIIVLKETAYYSNLSLYNEDKSVYMTLYCSGASQLSWLFDYLDTLYEFYVYVRDTKTGSSLRIEILDLVS